MTSDTKGLDELKIDRADLDGHGSSRGRVWLSAGILVVLATAALWWLGQRPVEVRTEEAQAETTEAGLRTVLNASGYVVARREATVSSKMTGKVAQVLIEEGMRVEQGQVLAHLDAANIRTQLELAMAREATARAALLETQVRLDEADRERARVLALAGQGVTSAAEVDRVEAEVKSLRARLERQAKEIAVADRQVAVLEQDLEDTVIRAPFSGVVVTKNAQPGEMISPISAGGGFTRTGIGTIVDMDSLEIEVDVNESFLHRVRTGQPVEAVLDAYPGWQVPSRVLAIIPTADRQRATVRVRVAFNELDDRILPQMGVRVAFLEMAPATDAESRSLLISRTALRRDGDDYRVWVVRDGQLEQRRVTVRAPEANPVAVTGDLQAGEWVVIEGPADLETGRRVRERRG